MDILIFKTNLAEACDREKVAPVLEDERRITRWNLDQQDVDRVLRIEANNLIASDVIDLVTAIGYQCEELPD